MVYFAEVLYGRYQDFCYAPEDGPLRIIKIGNSKNPLVRACQLEYEYRFHVSLLAMMDGELQEEREIQELFDYAHVDLGPRSYAEWFYPVRDLIEFVRDVDRSWQGPPWKENYRIKQNKHWILQAGITTEDFDSLTIRADSIEIFPPESDEPISIFSRRPIASNHVLAKVRTALGWRKEWWTSQGSCIIQRPSFWFPGEDIFI